MHAMFTVCTHGFDGCASNIEIVDLGNLEDVVEPAQVIMVHHHPGVLPPQDDVVLFDVDSTMAEAALLPHLPQLLSQRDQLCGEEKCSRATAPSTSPSPKATTALECVSNPSSCASLPAEACGSSPRSASSAYCRRMAVELTRATHMQKLRCFLAAGGFRSVNAPKATGLRAFSRNFSYPLHTAVRANDEQAVEALLWAGCDKALEDSHGSIALHLARKLNKDGSHTKLIQLLEREPVPPEVEQHGPRLGAVPSTGRS